jgi:hypothetical protein
MKNQCSSIALKFLQILIFVTLASFHLNANSGMPVELSEYYEFNGTLKQNLEKFRYTIKVDPENSKSYDLLVEHEIFIKGLPAQIAFERSMIEVWGEDKFELLANKKVTVKLIGKVTFHKLGTKKASMRLKTVDIEFLELDEI